MIPFLGIGTLPALTALIIYALFPILQNTITGLSEIPPALDEAAEALGMNRWEKLKIMNWLWLCRLSLPESAQHPS